MTNPSFDSYSTYLVPLSLRLVDHLALRDDKEKQGDISPRLMEIVITKCSGLTRVLLGWIYGSVKFVMPGYWVLLILSSFIRQATLGYCGGSPVLRFSSANAIILTRNDPIKIMRDFEILKKEIWTRKQISELLEKWSFVHGSRWYLVRRESVGTSLSLGIACFIFCLFEKEIFLFFAKRSGWEKNGELCR